MFHRRIAAIGIAAIALAISLPAASRGPRHGRHHGGIHYQVEVEVENLTRAQQFTLLLVAIHHPAVDVFEPGTPALPELATLAETGNPVPLSNRLDATRGVAATARGDSLTAPGQKTAIDAPAPGYRTSLAAMMIPTNDGLAGLDAARLPAPGRSVSYTLYAYDAGSEPNDESCASIPGLTTPSAADRAATARRRPVPRASRTSTTAPTASATSMPPNATGATRSRG